ncbi:Z1 domain-containing protein [Salibacterium qingdaonense]|uniref:Z1 domain-containing protein n=1 Tax=Salibacterium qingdaonense TaxID=266892 RepID=A0A1I4LJE6_9BACI|nr:Z1 domain-containing protein [Salibacterium qingdaonense]SFL91164.1 Z1 domain-containing protein [Salibacterium qingdaonense]
MNDVSDVKYDKVREWIKTERDHDENWHSIAYAKKQNEQGLKDFLERKEDEDRWPQISPHEWYVLVEGVKRVEDEAVAAQVKNQEAMITENAEINSSKVPEDRKSSWQLYKNNLIDKNFKESAIAQIESASQSILSQLSSDTTNMDPVKGMVVGNVQSGKTANMAGLMAMAADHGWNMFIVLSGMVENLRKQTQERLIQDLRKNGNINWMPLSNVKRNAPTGSDVQNYYFIDSNDAHLYVCLKNKTRLQGLLDWMQKDLNKYEQMKVLVIDDEADQGSINTADISTSDRNTINRLIVNLVEGYDKNGTYLYKKPKAMNYVCYTATPYANFLNEYSLESLYPRHFIKSLSTSNDYFGPKEIFGVEGHEDFQGLDIIRRIGDPDMEQIENIHKGHDFNIPKSLEESIGWFLCAVSSLKVQGYKKPLTMMIHTSPKQEHHSNISHSIKLWLNNKTFEEIIDTCRDVWNKETNRFTKNKLIEMIPHFDDFRDKMYDFQQFEEIKEEIYTLIQDITHIQMDEEGDFSYSEHIHLCVDNCSNNGINEDGMFVRLAYPDKIQNEQLNHATAFIVVGGTTLSRGLTMEGLVSTYFKRSVKQADTLMQMGRWFGYRPNYEIYPRVWMPSNTKQKFEFLSTLEYELRETLKQFSEGGASPKEYGPRVKNTPRASGLRVTAANRQQAASYVDMDFTGSSAQTILFNNDKKEQVDNIHAAEAFLSSLESPEIKNNRVVWRDVDFNTIKNQLLKAMTFHPNTHVFSPKDLDPFIEWVEEKSEKKLLNNWNVIVSGTVVKDSDPQKIWEVPNAGQIGKVTRNRKESSEGSSTINIGVLRAPSDLYADVDTSKLSQSEADELTKSSPSVTKVGEIRKSAGLQDTPQLIIYRIYKNSTSASTSKFKNRPNLDAEEDIIGLCLRIPGTNTSTGKSYGALQIEIPQDKQDIGEIEDED